MMETPPPQTPIIEEESDSKVLSLTLLQNELKEVKESINLLISSISESTQKTIDQLAFQTKSVATQLGQLGPVFRLVEEFEKSREDGLKSYIINQIYSFYIQDIKSDIGKQFNYFA